MWLLLPILFYCVIYLYIRHVYSHWERKGFPTERTGLSMNFLKSVYKREFHYVDAVCDAYHAGREHLLFGIYFFFRPTLLICDLQLARTILDNSSGHFNNPKWDYVKDYRKMNLLEKLAPMFSGSRIDGMFRNIEKGSDHMVNYLERMAYERDAIIVDLQHIARVYSMSTIGNLVYGLDINNFEQTDCIFNSYINNSLRSHNINSFTLNHLPKRSSLTYRLRDIIKESVESREDGGCIRKDILQLLVKFRNGNDIGSSNAAVKHNWHIENVFEREKILSVKKLSKVAEEFLNMGVDSTASIIVFTFYEILSEPSIMRKLLGEFEKVKSESNPENQKLNYEMLCKLTYMDMCVEETLRKYPSLPVIERVCRKNFNIPASRYMLREGKTIMIPLMAIQRDPKYYEDPLIYRPERFLKRDKTDNKLKQPFIGYGIGPATCVASNFSKCIVKVALVKLLQEFSMELLNGNVEIMHRPTPFIKDGFQVKIKKREIKSKFYI